MTDAGFEAMWRRDQQRARATAARLNESIREACSGGEGDPVKALAARLEREFKGDAMAVLSMATGLADFASGVADMVAAQSREIDAALGAAMRTDLFGEAMEER